MPWRVRAQAPAECALRASPAVAALAEAAGRGAARRMDRTLTLGAPLEDDTPRALGDCVFGLVRGPGGLRLFAADAAGQVRTVEVGDDGDAAATARAVAVALTTLLRQLEVVNPPNTANPDSVNPANPTQPDAANPANPGAANNANPDVPGNPTNSPESAAGTPGNPALGETLRDTETTPLATFVASVHARAPFSTMRATTGAGLGGALGVCFVETVCVLVSAEYVLPAERPSWAGVPASYRWGNAAVVAQLAVLRRGAFMLGAGLGVVARLSEVTLDGRTTRGASLSAGTRVQVEGSVALARAWALVLGLGTDFYVDRAAFVQGGQTLLVEDFVTPWAALSLRFSAP
jgi:hypothetical protein